MSDWKSMFHVGPNFKGEWLLMKRGENISHNMVFYKSKGRADAAANKIYNAIQRKIENILLIND